MRTPVKILFTAQTRKSNWNNLSPNAEPMTPEFSGQNNSVRHKQRPATLWVTMETSTGNWGTNTPTQFLHILQRFDGVGQMDKNRQSGRIPSKKRFKYDCTRQSACWSCAELMHCKMKSEALGAVKKVTKNLEKVFRNDFSYFETICSPFMETSS
ncbi:hypothetical protein PAMP_012598 [Pampus punctatissimus]